jgi:fructokinase
MNQKPPLIIGLGEILWDMIPEGKKLGGAPTNFAYHCQLMGAKSYVLSRVGDDMAGKELIQVTEALGLDVSHIQQDEQHPTGTVSVWLDKQGHPEYTIHEEVAWDYIRQSPADLELSKRADAICFGSLAQRNLASRESMMKILEASPDDCLRVFDMNLRQHFYTREVIVESLKQASILKLNDDELVVVSELLDLIGSDQEILDQLRNSYELELAALTRGSEGSVLLSRSGLSVYKSQAVEVADSIGAGDSFTAALVMGLLNKLSIRKIHEAASDLAAYVCTQHGATPEVPPHVFKAIQKTQ